MSILDDIKKIKGSPRDLKNFGLFVGGICLGLGLLFFYISRESWIVFAVSGISLIIIGSIVPKALAPIYKVWMIFGTMMGFLVTNVILTGFFYLIFTPLAVILRLSGKHFLSLNFHTSEKSYWNRRSGETTKSSLEKQF